MLEKNYGNSCSLLERASLSDYNELLLFQVVQQPSGGNADQVTTISRSSPLTTQKCGPKMLANTIVPTSKFPTCGTCWHSSFITVNLDYGRICTCCIKRRLKDSYYIYRDTFWGIYCFKTNNCLWYCIIR